MLITAGTKDALDKLISAKSNRSDGGYTFLEIQEIAALDSPTRDRIIKEMIQKNLAEYFYPEYIIPGGAGGKAKPKGIILTQDGFCYKELDHRERIERWKDRLSGFVLGIAASVVASLIISWITG